MANGDRTQRRRIDGLASFVLIPGAFHGAWCWKAVAGRLTALGHDVHRLDLTGQGARVHLATAATGLAEHIRDVLEYVCAEDLEEVVLVGHSYAGMVITGAADLMPERFRHVIYLDAVVPQDGQRAIDLVGADIAHAAVGAAAGFNGWLVPQFLPLAKYGIPADQQAGFVSKLRPHPIRTFFDPIQLSNTAPLRRSFIYCAADPIGIFDQFATLARADPEWGYYELATSHDAMLTDPIKLSEILDAAAV